MTAILKFTFETVWGLFSVSYLSLMYGVESDDIFCIAYVIMVLIA